MNNKEVVLYLTDKINDKIIDNFIKLKNDVENDYDVLILFHNHQDNEIPKELNNYNHFIFTDDDIYNKLGYKPFMGKRFMPGNSHFPIFYFFNSYNIKYEHYWRIENDAIFTGNWRDLLTDIPQEYDFVASHIQRHNEFNESWFWFSSTFNKLPKDLELFKSFAPVLRLSNKAITHLDNTYKIGYCGHFELTIPTFLYNYGFKLGDFGGYGEFLIPTIKEKYYDKIGITNEDIHNYSNYTFRFRPTFVFQNELVLKNKLYHPYKPYI